MGKKKLVFGVGIKDENLVTTVFVNGKSKMCPYYQRWYDMFRRCYSETYQKNNPSYKGCSVCNEWLTFSNFKKWMETQDWENKTLDKDLLDPSNNVYCPEKCIFVDICINCLFLDAPTKRGKLMLGVCYVNKKKDMVNEYKKPYRACVREYGNKKQIHISSFVSEFDAHRAWQKAKLNNLDKVKDIYKNDDAVVMIITQRYNKLKYDYDNNLETKSLHHY